MSTQNPIQLIIFDIDGVLTEGETKALDLELLADLARLNRESRGNPAFPAVTLCSGRPAQYVELMLQAIDGHLPGVFENGAGLYVPDTYRFLPNPALSKNGNLIPTIRRRLEETIIKSGEAYFQPGKEYTLTLFASDPAGTGKLYDLAAAALGELKRDVKLVYSTYCLNILPHHIDKGEGIRFLSDWTGYALPGMLGVGDTDVDQQFLSIVGYSAAPANGSPAIKSIVQYASPFRTGEGVRDILAHFNIPIP